MEKERCMCALSYWDVMAGLEELKKAFFRYKEDKSLENKLDVIGKADILKRRLELLDKDCGIDTSFERSNLESVIRGEKDVEGGIENFLLTQGILNKMIFCARKG